GREERRAGGQEHSVGRVSPSQRRESPRARCVSRSPSGARSVSRTPPRARRGSPRRRTQRLPSSEEEMEAPPTASERRQEEEEEGDDDGGEEGPTNKMARRFTSDENGALVDEVLARWDVLFGSRSHRISAARRQHHWQQVTDKVNTVGALHRDRPTVYKRFSDLKRWLRAKLVTRRAKAQKTGGGQVPPLRLKPYERRLLDILSKEGSEGVDTDWRSKLNFIETNI
ncbi:unnamed protein product, partial [Protopolystoma xenopodis]